MNTPIVICEMNFQEAWRKACIILSENNWELWDVIVEVQKPLNIDEDYNEVVTKFAKDHRLIKPKDVAYTIFPYGFYDLCKDSEQLYKKYWRFYRYTRKKEHSGWGTYFERMIGYENGTKPVDQLGNIIKSINLSDRILRAAYTMIIPKPGYENIRHLGSPCLNYVAIRTEPTQSGRRINLLAVYRNHDFLERAYGNYFGLCKLLEYIACETNSEVGRLTCISSHAYVPELKKDLRNFISSVHEKSDSYE
jgi:thymidylate synthase